MGAERSSAHFFLLKNMANSYINDTNIDKWHEILVD
jgi:hypothetical protein